MTRIGRTANRYASSGWDAINWAIPVCVLVVAAAFMLFGVSEKSYKNLYVGVGAVCLVQHFFQFVLLVAASYRRGIAGKDDSARTRWCQYFLSGVALYAIYGLAIGIAKFGSIIESILIAIVLLLVDALVVGILSGMGFILGRFLQRG